jgi:hypothetical protein
MATRKGQAMKVHPGAGIDVVHHKLSVDMMRVLKEGKNEQLELLETLVFEGRMTLQRENPVIVKSGAHKNKKQTGFTVVTWVASAFSEKLQVEILYILSEGVKQKSSVIRAEEAGKDFPAEFIFNVTFDARANNKTIKRRHHGMPHDTGFRTIPPNGDRTLSPTIKKFESEYIHIDHPEFGKIRFVPRHCNDEDGVTLVALA